VYNDNVMVLRVMRVVVGVVMRIMIVDNHGWFVSDDNFIGADHRCESRKAGDNYNNFHWLYPYGCRSGIPAYRFSRVAIPRKMRLRESTARRPWRSQRED
jgi:hypothetical protein